MFKINPLLYYSTVNNMNISFDCIFKGTKGFIAPNKKPRYLDSKVIRGFSL